MMNDEIVFLGDSLTEWGPWDEFFPHKNILNMGVAGDKTGDIRNRLDGLFKYYPRKLFFMAGINDLGDGIPVNVVVTQIASIINSLEEVWPETDFFILSVLPVSLDDWENPNLSNSKINELNSLIKEKIESFNLNYIDLNPQFRNSDGFLKDSLSIDGLHLNNEGYKVWKSVIEKYIN